MLLITQMSYLRHYWQHAYNLNILASIIQLDLHYWPSRAPFIRDEEREQSATSCKGWPADWVSQHCQTNQHTGNALEPLGNGRVRTENDRGRGAFRVGREPRLFFFLKKRYPTFVQRRMKYPLRLVTLGILFQLSSFCCDSRAEARNLGWQGFKLRWERKRIPSKDFFYCLLKNKYL